MPRFDSVYDFRKAAGHRLRDAEELLEQPSLDSHGSDHQRRHLRGAMYLSGYAVECILKAYLVSMHAPLATLEQVDSKLRQVDPSIPNLLSAEGHNVAIVLRYTDLEAYQGDLQRRQFGQIAGGWSVDMRYNPSVPTRARAIELVSAAGDLYKWVNSRF